MRGHLTRRGPATLRGTPAPVGAVSAPSAAWTAISPQTVVVPVPANVQPRDENGQHNNTTWKVLKKIVLNVNK